MKENLSKIMISPGEVEALLAVFYASPLSVFIKKLSYKQIENLVKLTKKLEQAEILEND